MLVYTRDVQPSSQGSDRVENRVSPLDGPTPRLKEILAMWFTSRNSWLKLTLTFVAMTSAILLVHHTNCYLFVVYSDLFRLTLN